MPDITVVPSADVDVVSAVLATAFAADPVLRWLNPTPDRDEMIFRTLLKWVHGSGSSVDLALRDSVPVGAGVWDPPGYRVPVGHQVASVWGFLLGLRMGVGRGLALERRFRPARPDEPHWYLAQLGAATQGVGVGSALLTAGLERVEGPAYLESSNKANIPLYERFGFRVVGEIMLPSKGPIVWRMYRK